MKKGLSAFLAFSMYSSVNLVTSSSMVSIRFLPNGPVLSIFCLPSGKAQQCSTPPSRSA